MSYKKDNENSTTSTALTAVAFQDHLVKSLGLTDFIGPHHVPLGPAAKAKSKRPIKSVISTGKFGRNPPTVKNKETKEKEYVLDPKPPPLTLGMNNRSMFWIPNHHLLHSPKSLVWLMPLTNHCLKLNGKKLRRSPTLEMTPRCPVLYARRTLVYRSRCCYHVPMSSTEPACKRLKRFTGKKTCPMCRKEQYQTRVIHEGSRHHRHKCATMIQACWRGYVVRCMYRKLRESNPPKDPRLRKKFFEEKLHSITERMVKSCDFDVHSFLREMDSSLAASRKVFRDFDTRFQPITEDQWEAIQLRARIFWIYSLQ
ncbi:hypothetical protein DPMN_127615 [Dreissena polymorpha]|uniref:Uncharacterized protein n=1 Tax=Dreissena polymorpha TaxID=45954 RepID=A0A9D4H2C6_DREPO|nr:hypothetical protein DPMN_127615 [Dreissena polymorpha]